MREMVDFTCEICGEGFQRPASTVRTRAKFGIPIRVCSRVCRSALLSQEYQGRTPPNKTPDIPFTCEVCGTAFTRTQALVDLRARRGGRIRTCSATCNGKLRSREQAPRNGPGNPAWKGGISVTWYRRMYETDLPHECAECRSEADLQVHHVNQDRADNSLSNLRVLCRKCHMRLHARLRAALATGV